jgi:hypothetical protein
MFNFDGLVVIIIAVVLIDMLQVRCSKGGYVDNFNISIIALFVNGVLPDVSCNLKGNIVVSGGKFRSNRPERASFGFCFTW